MEIHRSIYQYPCLLFAWMAVHHAICDKDTVEAIFSHKQYFNDLSCTNICTPQTHTCSFSIHGSLFSFCLCLSLFLSLPFPGVRTMALSHHGNSTLMWSWPDIPIDISVEWHQYLIIQIQNRAVSTIYSYCQNVINVRVRERERRKEGGKEKRLEGWRGRQLQMREGVNGWETGRRLSEKDK